MLCVLHCAEIYIFSLCFVEIEAHAIDLMHKGLRGSTHQVYSSGQKKYFMFCTIYNYLPLPTNEKMLCNFVAFLNLQGLKASTVQVYLAAIKSLHIYEGYSYPSGEMPRLGLILRALKNESKPPVKKLPITFDLLCRIVNSSILPFGYDRLLFITVCSLLFHGGFRCGEVIPKGKYDFKMHLTLYSISYFVDHSVVKQKQSKTSKTQVSVMLPCTKHMYCAHCLLKNYFLNRVSVKPVDILSPLFVTSDGNPYFYADFVKLLRKVLAHLGVYDPKMFSGHSFRAGLATQAAMKGLSDLHIQKLGRWRSRSFTGYCRDNLDEFRYIFNKLLA